MELKCTVVPSDFDYQQNLEAPRWLTAELTVAAVVCSPYRYLPYFRHDGVGLPARFHWRLGIPNLKKKKKKKNRK